MLKKPVLNLIWVIVKWKKKNKENNKEHGKENALLNERGKQFQLPKQEQAVANNLLGENNIPAIGGNNLKQDQNNPQPEVGTDNSQNNQLLTGDDLVNKALAGGATVEEAQALTDYLISDNGSLNAVVDAADITNGEIITQQDLDGDDIVATIPVGQVNGTNSLIDQVNNNMDQQNTNSLISQVNDNIDQQNQVTNTIDASIDNVDAPSVGDDDDDLIFSNTEYKSDTQEIENNLNKEAEQLNDSFKANDQFISQEQNNNYSRDISAP